MSIDKSENNLNGLILKQFVAKQLSVRITFSNCFMAKMFKESKPKPLLAKVLLTKIYLFGCCSQNILNFFLPWLCNFFDGCLNKFDFLFWFKVVVAQEYP